MAHQLVWRPSWRTVRMYTDGPGGDFAVYVNFVDNTPLLETVPQGDFPLAVLADPESLQTLRALAEMENLDLARALGALFVAGMRAAETTGIAPHRRR